MGSAQSSDMEKWAHEEKIRQMREQHTKELAQKADQAKQLALDEARRQTGLANAEAEKLADQLSKMSLRISAERDELHKQQLQQQRAYLDTELERHATEAAAKEKSMKEEAAAKEKRMEAQRLQEAAAFDARIAALQESLEKGLKRQAELQAELEKPIKERQEKVDFVNSLKLQISTNSALLLVGMKGMGKSTFVWLLGRGDRPSQSFSDGTVNMLALDGFVDTIGLRGWTHEELLKLIVLLIYTGIPKDLIIFGNDRIEQASTILGLLGIINPMTVIMSSDFWKNYAPPEGRRKRINVIESGKGARRVDPEEDLEMVYNMDIYRQIEKMNIGTPVTHHDDIDKLVLDREFAGIKPFKHLTDRLGCEFHVNMEQDASDNVVEMLFRFIYVFEKNYKKDKLSFMNTATLGEFGK